MPPPLLSARACQPQEGKRPREREVERKGNERGQKNERQGFSLLFWRAKAEAGEKENVINRQKENVMNRQKLKTAGTLALSLARSHARTQTRAHARLHKRQTDPVTSPHPRTMFPAGAGME
jgi:hypothetical protein